VTDFVGSVVRQPVALVPIIVGASFFWRWILAAARLVCGGSIDPWFNAPRAISHHIFARKSISFGNKDVILSVP
jgi:hypothetical protein